MLFKKFERLDEIKRNDALVSLLDGEAAQSSVKTLQLKEGGMIHAS